MAITLILKNPCFFCLFQEKALNLYQQFPPRFPQNSVPGRNFYFYAMRKYVKQPLEIQEQIAILKERGLIFLQEEYAINKLKQVSYFRLANYWKPMEQDKIRHTFKPQCTFENALSLYYFDKELRNLLFTSIQTIEIALRTKMIHHVSLQCGAFWFANNAVFTNQDIFNKCLDNLQNELKRSKEDFISEHYAKYDEPIYPPAWKTLEVSSFGTLSKLYCNLSDVKLKKQIAREFGLPQHIYLESWIKSLSVLRNYIAHHARLWNRKFPWKPQLPKKLSSPWINNIAIQQEKLYSQLCCINYLLKGLNTNTELSSKIQLLLDHHPNIDTSAMGFPENWREEPLWKNED